MHAVENNWVSDQLVHLAVHLLYFHFSLTCFLTFQLKIFIAHGQKLVIFGSLYIGIKY